MGQYETNFCDSLRLFQMTNGHREPYHKKTVEGGGGGNNNNKSFFFYIILIFFLFEIELKQET